MADNIQSIAAKRARVVAQVPDVGGGAFGAARLGQIVRDLHGDTVAVPVDAETLQKLVRLAERASGPGRAVEPREVAARLLAEAVASAADV